MAVNTVFHVACLRSVWFSHERPWIQYPSSMWTKTAFTEKQKKILYIYTDEKHKDKQFESKCWDNKITQCTLKIYAPICALNVYNQGKTSEHTKRQNKNNAQTWMCSSRNSINVASPWKRNVHFAFNSQQFVEWATARHTTATAIAQSENPHLQHPATRNRYLYIHIHFYGFDSITLCVDSVSHMATIRLVYLLFVVSNKHK